MGKRALLMDEEHGRIKGLHEAGLGIREIAKRLRRSTDTIRRVLGSDGSEEHKRMGPERLMSEHAVRLLVRTAATGDFSAAQLKHEVHLDASVRAIQRVLSHVDWLVYSKMENMLPLSKSDKAARKQWAWGMRLGAHSPALWEHILERRC